MIKEIKKHNGESFLLDLKKSSEVMAYVESTGEFFQIKKQDIKKCAAEREIKYYLTREIFRVGRLVMVVI